MIKKGLGKGLAALLEGFDKEIEENIKRNQENETDYPIKEDNLNEFERKITSSQNFMPDYNSKPSTNYQKITNGETTLNISEIYPNPNQPRKNFDIDALNELADSIRVHGLIQPIIVNKEDDGYMIIADERRYKACKMAGITEVPVLIKNYTKKQISEIAIIENLQREDLNPIELARGIKQLMEEYSLTQEKVAERLGKGRSAITNTLRLLNLYPEVIEMVEKGKVSQGHAKCLVAITDYPTQLSLAKKVAQDKLSVRALEKEINLLTGNNKKKKIFQQPSLELKDLINQMQRVFGTKVTLLGNDKKGRIYIDYYSQDDLDRIYDVINNNG